MRNYKRIDWAGATPGSFHARLLRWFAAAFNFFMPGSFETQLECRLCGEVVAKNNTDEHLAFFHPERPIC